MEQISFIGQNKGLSYVLSAIFRKLETDADVNVDLESHPVGCSTPQRLLFFVCLSDLNFAFFFLNQRQYEEQGKI